MTINPIFSDMVQHQPVSVASAATCDIGAAISDVITVTGTTTITSFGTKTNKLRYVKFAAALTLTHNATSLILPTAANITTAAGDTAVFASDGSGNWTCLAFARKNGNPLNVASAPFGPFTALASAATCDLSSVSTIGVGVTGTTTITSFGTGTNLFRLVKFAAVLTLTHNATSLILPGGGNITTAAGDTAILLSDASGNWVCLAYQRAATPPIAGTKTLTVSANLTLAGTDGQTFTFPASSAAVLTTANTATISKGFTLTPNSLGNITSFTIDPTLGNYQYGTNHGAATWTAPASDCAVDILVTNDATAGAITFSGFTVGANVGDSLTTTNGHKFIISIRRINSVSTYIVKALQ